jgi:predicted ATPase with chaperone activity
MMTPDDIKRDRATTRIIARLGVRSTDSGLVAERWSAALDEVERLRDTTSRTVVDHRVAGAIRLVRATWSNDGADGESVHLICDEVERLTKENATLLEQANAGSGVVAADWNEIKALRGRVADLERELAAVREIEAGTAIP